jgi:hypothetical protein
VDKKVFRNGITCTGPAEELIPLKIQPGRLYLHLAKIITVDTGVKV